MLDSTLEVTRTILERQLHENKRLLVTLPLEGQLCNEGLAQKPSRRISPGSADFYDFLRVATMTNSLPISSRSKSICCLSFPISLRKTPAQ